MILQSYDLYLWITRSPLAARQRTLKTEILTTKSELLKTSAQDQFDKWAKLRRSVDKGLADLEKPSEYFLLRAMSVPYSLNCFFCAFHGSFLFSVTDAFLYFCAANVRRGNCGIQKRFCNQVQNTPVNNDDRTAIFRYLVVPKTTNVLPSRRLVGPTDLVVVSAVCTCWYVIFPVP